MLLADETAAQTHLEFRLIHCRDALVEVPVGIHTANDAAIVVGKEITLKIRSPEITLTTIHAFQRHTLGRTKDNPRAAKGVIHTERPLLVGAENESAAKLVVDVAHRHSDEAIVVGGEEVGQPNAIQLFAEAVHLRQESLKANASGEIAVGIVDFPEAVDAQFLPAEVGNADAFVKHIVLCIRLEAAVHLTILLERLSTRLETKAQSECND